MDFFLGLLVGIIILISFTLGFVLSRQYDKTSEKEEATKTRLEKEHIKKQKGFNNIMNYDINVALGNTEQLEE